MGSLLKGVTKLLGLGGDSNRIADEMRRQAQDTAARLEADAERQANQTRQNAQTAQLQQEAAARQMAAQEQARRMEQQAARDADTVELGDTPTDPEADIEEEARRRNPRAQYMAPTGAYTGISLQL